MPNSHSGSDTPPQVQYDKELRALYQERNARSSFRIPGRGHQLYHHWYLQLFVMAVAAAAVGLLAALTAFNSLPQPTPTSLERVTRPAVPASELSDDLKHRVASAVVSFLPQRPGVGTVGQPYLARDAAGQGLVLSSDGWLVTTSSVIPPGARSYQVASSNGHLYPAELALADPVAPLTFLKTSATNLTATPFADVASLSVGQPVAVVALSLQSASPAFYLRRLAHLSARAVHSTAELPVGTETLPDRYLLDEALPPGSQGAPVTTLRGEVVGLVADYEGQLRAVVSLDNVGAVIDQLFAVHELHRPALGLSYLQGAWVAPFVSDSTSAEGATVTAVLKRSGATTKGAPVTADLKAGDRIVAIAGERITERSLSSLLQQYHPGTRLELLVSRQGQEQKLNVVLGEVVSKPTLLPTSGK